MQIVKGDHTFSIVNNRLGTGTDSYPCLSLDIEGDLAFMALEWDLDGDNITQDDKEAWFELALEDAKKAGQLLPEAGRAIFYETERGFHAIWTKPTRRCDVMAVLDLLACEVYTKFAGDDPNKGDRRAYVYVGVGGQGYGGVCGWFYAYWKSDTGQIRVGRKAGRGADIRRRTPIHRDDGDFIELHDDLVRRFNHLNHSFDEYVLLHQGYEEIPF